MPYDTPLVRRVVAMAAALLFFVGVFGAFAVGDTEPDSDEFGGDMGGDSSLLMPDDAVDELPDDGGLPGAPDEPGGAATTAAPPGGAQAPATPTTLAPAGPACPRSSTSPVDPPAPGTYRYDRKITEGGDTEQKQADVRYEPACTEGAVTRQKMVVKEEQGTFTNTLAWSADAVRLEHTRIESSFGAYDCDWVPDSTEIALPLSAGKTWKVDSTCTANVDFNGQQIAVTVRRTADFRVTGQKKDTVGGTSVNVWVVEGNQVIETSGGFNQRQEVESLAHLAPDYGLRVYTKEVTKGTAGDATVEQKLTSLKPR